MIVPNLIHYFSLTKSPSQINKLDLEVESELDSKLESFSISCNCFFDESGIDENLRFI